MEGMQSATNLKGSGQSLEERTALPFRPDATDEVPPPATTTTPGPNFFANVLCTPSANPSKLSSSRANRSASCLATALAFALSIGTSNNPLPALSTPSNPFESKSSMRTFVSSATSFVAAPPPPELVLQIAEGRNSFSLM